MTNSNTIHLMDSDALSGVLTAPTASGVSPIFRAKIRVNGESVRCYVKPQPDIIHCPATGTLVPNREVINEAIGHVLAKSCGLLTPDTVGIILLNQNQIPESVRLGLWNISDEQASYLCWFSKDMIHPNLAQKHISANDAFLQDRQVKRLAHALSEDKDTPQIIAFDDWLKNTDRHIGNLLESQSGRRYLIDHGRILNFPNWYPGKLGMTGPNIPAENRLKKLIDTHVEKWSEKLPVKSSMMMAYKSFSVSFRSGGEIAARKVLNDFFESEEVDSIISLLHTMNTPANYAKASGMLSI